MTKVTTETTTAAATADSGRIDAPHPAGTTSAELRPGRARRTHRAQAGPQLLGRDGPTEMPAGRAQKGAAGRRETHTAAAGDGCGSTRCQRGRRGNKRRLATSLTRTGPAGPTMGSRQAAPRRDVEEPAGYPTLGHGSGTHRVWSEAQRGRKHGGAACRCVGEFNPASSRP